MKNFLLLLSCWLLATTTYATRYYVKTNGNDTNDGQSWNMAFATLQKALESTTGNNDEIWVAAGTYYPTNGADRFKTFSMKNGVAIYGGFAGTENTLTDRVSALIHSTNKTILSGDIDLDGLLDDENVYQVIRNEGVNSTAQLDGFTISGGYANGSNTYQYGGGMYNSDASPTVTNCRFSNNRADSGGGMAILASTPKLIRCVFSGNTAVNGAGVINISSSSQFTNCSFFGNKATGNGGGINIQSSSPVFTNCSFSGSQAAVGGAMHTSSGTSEIKMRNCLVWGNNTELYPTASGGSITYTFTTTIVKGMNNGSGIFDGTRDPNFMAQPDQYAVPTTVGNMQLAICSPALNAGDNTVFNPGQTPDLSAITTDLAGNSRIFNTTIDLGAYEMQSVATTVYVKSDGDDTNDGLTWGTAFKTLQRALDFVCNDKQIWVAAGKYYPTEGSGRSRRFVMKGGVTMYGGFAGTENTLADRVSSLIHTTNKTTLSGDVDEDGLLDGENAYHVIRNQNIGGNAQIDGFTISDGYANGTAIDHYGGGMLNINSSPTVTNCRFTNNRGDYGGGMANRANSSPIITNCSFIGNFGDDGGGLYDIQSPTYIISDCLFSNNTANWGGGVYISGTTPTLIRCVFSGNSATYGAGVLTSNSASIFTNCSFLGNKATNQGGGFCHYRSTPVLTNCSFSGNKAPQGGGIDALDGYTSEIKLRNCIIWGNDTEIYPMASGGDVTYTFTNTIVKGMNNGSGVFDGTQDPLFMSQPDYALAPTTIGNLQLQACSPAINVGNNTVFNPGQTPDLSTITTDLAGNSRIFNTTVDLGAYEYQSDNSLTIAEYSSNPTTCGGTDGSITLYGLLLNTTYSVTYTKNAASLQTLSLTSDGDGLITLEHLTAGSYTNIIATYGSCVSNAVNITLNDPDKPTLVLGVVPAVCKGTSSISLPFSDLTASPDQYSLDYNSIAEGAGFTDINQAALPAASFSLPIPLSASAATYTASLTIRNSTTGCSSLPQNIVVTINPQPVGPTLNTKTPNAATICFGTGVTATFNAGSGGVGCSDDYVLIIDNGTPVTYTPGSTVGATAATSIVIQGRRANCNAGSGCSGTGYLTLASWNVNLTPVGPTLNTKTPNVAAVCFGTGVSATFNAGSGGVGCSDDYVLIIDNGTPVTYTPGSTVGATAATSIVIQGRRANCGAGSGCSGTGYLTLASWNINSIPTAIISGTAIVCKEAPAPAITFTATNGTAPYIFTYKVNAGSTQSVSTTGSNSSVTVSQSSGNAGIFDYALVSVSDGNNCGQNQSGHATITVNTKPTITLIINGQTFNEGNSQVLCDTDANPNNTLQPTVSTGCVGGTIVWRTQIGTGIWSEWSSTAPSAQPSNNVIYRYQAACTGSCPTTYTTPITLTINYRASVPQNVSLVADGTTVAAGQSASICDVSGNAISFNATCGAEEMLLYSVDGGDYSITAPSQIVDGNFHNYRIRCRKTDGTPSCVETESAVMSLKISTLGINPTISITPASGCGTATAFSGSSSCGALTTIWFDAATNQPLASLPATTPNATTSYYARCQNASGCLSEKSTAATFTITPVNDPPTISASAEIVCTGTQVTISANCPAGASAFWNTGITANSFQVAFNNVTKQVYWAKCIFPNGCQSPESVHKTIFWKAFDLTFINIGQSQSAIKPANDKAAWSNQFITADAGPVLENSTEANPTIFHSENLNKTAPRFWTIQVETCNLGTDGSVTYDMLAAPEVGTVRSYNTHENNAPYLMYANREGWTELYAQNHPAYGFYQDNGSGGNTYDAGLPKGLYKLGIRYWDQKGQGSIYPSTRQPAGNVLAYQEYWFRIQSQNGVGTGAARTAKENGEWKTENGAFTQIMPNPVTNTLHLKVNQAKGQKVNISLVDASGRALLQRAFVSEANQHQEELEVSHLANGMYFLQVKTADKQTTLKVIKAGQ